MNNMESISIGNWFFDYSHPLLIVISGLLLVSLLMTWRSCWRRLYPGRPPRAGLVVLLNLLAFFSVFILLTEPQRKQMVRQDVILLTEGADTETAGLFHGPLVYVSDDVAVTTEARRNLKNAHWLLDVAQLPIRQAALANIQVSGYGLQQSQWQDIPADINISFQPPANSGFTRMHWSRTMLSGETLRIGGRYSYQQDANQAGGSIIELTLLDPVGNTVNATRIRNGDQFSLATRPRGRGNLLYTLQARVGDTLLSEQTAGISVGSAEPINIMVQQSAPSFETRQLKNYAGGNAAQVIINTQISRDKSISQLANLADGSASTFSPASLAEQDVLIMDGRALIHLAVQRRQWLNDAIRNGLGLLILADASLIQEFEQLGNGLLSGFEIASNPDAKTEVVPRLLNKPAFNWQQTLPVAAMQLQATDADILIDDSQGNALVLNKPHGLGHISISLINQSHRWLTSGQRDDWSDYWAALIGAVARPRDSSYLLPQTDGAFFEAGERIPVCAMSTADSLVVTVIPAELTGGTAYDVPLTTDALGSQRQCGWYWALNSGWHQLQLRSPVNDRILDQQGVYIQQGGQWQAQKRQQRIDASMERLAGNTTADTAEPIGKWVSVPVETFWLWLLLVVSASLLWIERKFDFEW